MDKCRVHTILRLPTGIFYAQGVKTNVIFFTRGDCDTASTDAVWVYDLRTNMPVFSRRRSLARDNLRAFEVAFGSDPHGRSPRTDEGPKGRFRRFSREEIARRDNNLDIVWLTQQDSEQQEEISSPEEISSLIATKLQEALTEVEALIASLEGQEKVA